MGHGFGEEGCFIMIGSINQWPLKLCRSFDLKYSFSVHFSKYVIQFWILPTLTPCHSQVHCFNLGSLPLCRLILDSQASSRLLQPSSDPSPLPTQYSSETTRLPAQRKLMFPPSEERWRKPQKRQPLLKRTHSPEEEPRTHNRKHLTRVGCWQVHHRIAKGEVHARACTSC